MRTRRRVVKQDEPEPIRTRGPLGYAGPGSLGGTESALRTVTPQWRRAPLPAPLSAVLVVIGVLLLADAVTTLVWQEPVSALYSRLQQGKLDDKLAKLEGTEPTAVDRKVLVAARDARPPARLRGARAEPPHGRRRSRSGRIRMPSIGVSSVVVAGTGTADLRLGPGHYPGTPLPGARGTVAIAGHRTTYGAPFRKLDKVGTGDRIEVRMPYGTLRLHGRAAAHRRPHGDCG